MFPRALIALFLSLTGFTAHAESIDDGYAFAILGSPKYIYNFSHFDYVNPAAPKGGSITLSAIGTFDNFNRFASRGNAAIRSDTLYDSLFTPSSDEIGSYYPLIADSARYDSDFRWVEVEINPHAVFQDGSPITAGDVEFTFHKFMTEGVPQFRVVYKGVVVKAIAPLTVRFEFPQPNKEQMLGLLGLPVIPKTFWEHRKFNEPLATPPLGSGPYRITDYKLGQYIIYSRVPNYWAANLPVNRGRYNFNTIRYDYYLDDNVALQAFKSGAFDFRSEPSPKNWATQYQGSNFSRNLIIRQDDENKAAQDTRWLAFNIQRPIFKDRKVREALTLAFDFNWINKALFYGAYQRTDSYFQNTDYAAKNYPDAAELAWLAPLKGKVPDEVFSELYHPPSTDGSGNDRANLLKATALLKEAGWTVKNQQLVNNQTGTPFTFELLLPSSGNTQYVLPFQHNLQRLGITMNIRQVDNSQFISRLRNRDYDMIPTVYRAQPYPGTDLQIMWNSKYLNSTYNTPGVSDPAIDQLTNEIVAHQGQPDALLSLGRALDRVLTWHMYMIPMWYTNRDRYAYWDKFSMPEIRPPYSLELDTWWYDVNKASRLQSARQ
ncbi:extracellular solute-binding protein [Rouxiella badensis]|jgi:microcin C transport system substrate-binding protein|uniref:extracellular solute-binding protein n=1 Tax=Rouxiella badensis TaxID=1646377 RepID=UPI00037D93CC|nr:extracellular solute-binding protein [Rouxiella badensis]MCC3703204.1 extracellular solute-binding protein [Rouxiella badensis]MCC3735553.1 extracellular solute-binding protein [Rouxiella badensis]MCC3760850.1 extracellular solute-binding protein [Rouxiella badensis]QII36955.1 ABC transporter substrate-binding protein [Rouxiella badensis]QOI55801.1 ABC transporter substrate-binding protein [Rouxiella badensis subsp. acadiensis]